MVKKLVAHLEPNIEIKAHGEHTKFKIKVPLSEINQFLSDGFEVKFSIPSFDYKMYAGKKNLHKSNSPDVIKITGEANDYSIKYFCKIMELEVIENNIYSADLLTFIKEKIVINYNPEKSIGL